MLKKEEKLLTANVNETAKWWGWFGGDITCGSMWKCETFLGGNASATIWDDLMRK